MARPQGPNVAQMFFKLGFLREMCPVETSPRIPPETRLKIDIVLLGAKLVLALRSLEVGPRSCFDLQVVNCHSDPMRLQVYIPDIPLQLHHACRDNRQHVNLGGVHQL